jgi:hypothetical protein
VQLDLGRVVVSHVFSLSQPVAGYVSSKCLTRRLAGQLHGGVRRLVSSGASVAVLQSCLSLRMAAGKDENRDLQRERRKRSPSGADALARPSQAGRRLPARAEGAGREIPRAHNPGSRLSLSLAWPEELERRRYYLRATGR